MSKKKVDDLSRAAERLEETARINLRKPYLKGGTEPKEEKPAEQVIPNALMPEYEPTKQLINNLISQYGTYAIQQSLQKLAENGIGAKVVYNDWTSRKFMDALMSALLDYFQEGAIVEGEGDEYEIDQETGEVIYK